MRVGGIREGRRDGGRRKTVGEMQKEGERRKRRSLSLSIYPAKNRGRRMRIEEGGEGSIEEREGEEKD
jgi:hypothetical protein